MLDALRANKRGIITWAIVAGIVIIFAINFGPGSLSRGQSGGITGGTAQYAAHVNGETIGAQEFERQLNRLFEVYRAQSGGQLTRELAVQLGLPGQALDLLVERRVVIQEARRRGLVVPDEEIARDNLSNEAFFVNGQFDRQAYNDITRQNFGSESRYEETVRDNLLYGHMMASVLQTVKVPETDVREAWQASNDKAGLRYVIFPRSALEAEVKPTGAEVAAFAAKEGERIRAAYEANRARFEQQRKVRVRHVLARVAEGADDTSARRRIDEARARLAKGEDFAAVATELSDDEGTRASGGDLGFVAAGLFDPDFEKAALALEQGQVGEPVRTASGWHLIKAEEVVPARLVTLEQATPEVARELLVKDRAARLGAEKAAAALAAARSGRTPLSAFKARIGGRDLAAEETGLFDAAGEVVPRLGLVKELHAAALAAEAGTVLPRVFDTAAGPVIAEVMTRQRPDPAAWERERETFTSRLRGQKEVQVVQAWVKGLREASRIDRNEAYLAQIVPGANR